MASPSYTYTLTNGTTADATQVMQNFTDILNGVTDGTKDLSINALTCAGTATFNGNVNLGNASADDITITGSLASSIPIKTTNTYDIGSADLGLRAIYLGTGDADTGKLAAASGLTADRTYTFPDITGTVQVSNGVNSLSSAGYTITDTDGYHTILVSTGASQRTITLPAVANNSGRVIRIKKTDSGAGTVLIDTPSTEKIDGSDQNILTAQYAFVVLVSDGSNWNVTACFDEISNTTAIGSKVELAVSTTVYNICSLTITPGQWRLTSQILLTGSFSANNGWRTSIVSSSATNGTIGDNRVETPTSCNSLFDGTLEVVQYAANVTSSTAYYATASSNFTLGGGDHIYCYGKLVALRFK